jgi:hypothetical protein
MCNYTVTGHRYFSRTFTSDGATPKRLEIPGLEKSSISLLRSIPVGV